MVTIRSRKILTLCCLWLISLTTVHAGSVALYLQHYLEKQQHADLSTVEQHYFQQNIDHQNPALGTFLQRYYIDERYSTQDTDPVFFYICGESACTQRALDGAIRDYAKKFHAKLVALEHRFYGESLPFNSFATTQLQYLNTELALQDLAQFQQEISIAHHWHGQWVAFGGSYPGSLSAYYRLHYPHLVVGSLASSAPVMAKEDFFEYDAHIAHIAGVHCAQKMREVSTRVEAALDNPNQLEQFKTLFVANDIKHPIDFLYLIADIGAAAVQYGMKDTFCNALTSSADPLIGYAHFAQTLYQKMGVSAVEMTAQGAMSESPEDYQHGVGQRQWFYQSCTEYGYWQNANPDQSKTTRSSLINLDYHHQLCERLFGIQKSANTQRINNLFYYPLINSFVTRIYFTNGEQDPWSTLSLNEKNGNNQNRQLTYSLIAGAAHCDDLHQPTDKDSNALRNARRQMEQLLTEWLYSEKQSVLQ